ncbi:MAG: hypothetical protein ABIT20_21695 [Gemmatimonadaceae bacterium]
MKSRDERANEYVRLLALLPKAREQLMRYPGVRDVAVGVKETNDLATEHIVFRVYVDEKKPKGSLAPDAVIPPVVEGVATDVVLEPTAKLIDDTESYRPLLGGVQIGNDSSSALGTLGCIAKRNSDGAIVFLSCHHVMMANHADLGEKIGQPEISCCCCCKGNIVGEVVNKLDNALVDAAIAKVVGAPGFMNEILDIGPIMGSGPLLLGGSTVLPNDKVRKRGRSTGFTSGTVLTPLKGIGGKVQQIEIKPDPQHRAFAARGDSGSVIVNENNVVVGLLWSIDAATEKLGYANRIVDVVAAMGITILTSGTPGTIALGSIAVSDDALHAPIPTEPGAELTRQLERSDVGRRALALFQNHGTEINELLNGNRNVKVAWHRYQGPAFTGHFVKSAREAGHVIPAEIEGVSTANTLIRMSVVLQEYGSPALAAAVDECTVSMLTVISGATSVRDVLARLDELAHAY